MSSRCSGVQYGFRTGRPSAIDTTPVDQTVVDACGQFETIRGYVINCWDKSHTTPQIAVNVRTAGRRDGHQFSKQAINSAVAVYRREKEQAAARKLAKTQKSKTK